MTTRDFSEFLKSDRGMLCLLALAKLLLHFFTNGQYGYFRDELYYIDCSEHLDWGYVDQAPLIAVVTRAARLLFGESLFALRLFPAVAGALLVFLTGLITRELGGKRFAQLLAALAVIVAPIYLLLGTLLTMNAFEPLLWMLAAYLLLLIIKRENPRLWPLFGVVAGFGLLNKHSTLFFGFAVVVGLLLTPQRKFLADKWLWLGGFIAFLIFLPNLLWQVEYGWPTLEILKNVEVEKNYPVTPTEFFTGQILLMHPVTFPLWLAGLYFYLGSKEGRAYRALGWAYVIIFLVFIYLRAKVYYLAPAYPMLFAAGACVAERLFERSKQSWLKPATVSLIIVAGLVTAPLALPVLPVETYLDYSRRLGIQGVRTENHRLAKLPQHFADMFGWKEMAATVAEVYHRLPPDEQEKCAIFANNYGEAGAINFFGREYGLPRAISGHQNHYLWGPRDYSGEVVITIGSDLEDLEQLFEQVELGATIRHPYAMPYEDDLPVYVCRRMKLPLREFWPNAKRFV